MEVTGAWAAAQRRWGMGDFSWEIWKKLEILWSVTGCCKDHTAVPASMESVPGTAGELVLNGMDFTGRV